MSSVLSLLRTSESLKLNLLVKLQFGRRIRLMASLMKRGHRLMGRVVTSLLVSLLIVLVLFGKLVLRIVNLQRQSLTSVQVRVASVIENFFR